VIKIVIDDEGEKALLPEAEELLRRRAAEVGFSTLDWNATPCAHAHARSKMFCRDAIGPFALSRS
jgi:hypothetical protein